jgi:hypothetical protein
MKRILCVLVLIGFTSMIGYSQDTAATMSRRRKPFRGQSSQDAGSIAEPWRTYETICGHLLPGRRGLFRTAGVCGEISRYERSFHRYWSTDGATLGWFDPQRKMYKKIPIVGQHEVIGMSGDIALYQGKPVVHTHMVVGNSGRNNARRPCSRCVCIPDAGSDGDGRSDNDAKAV